MAPLRPETASTTAFRVRTSPVKLKRQPDDFRVEELTDFAPSSGPHALYRLTKRSLGTPEAVAAIARRWDLPRRAIAFGGLKDRHAATVQHLTIERGPRRGLRQENFSLEYVGQAERPFEARDIAGNRFQIVVRDLTADEAARIEAALLEIVRDGVPNYFDDQRFGSRTADGEFVALPWCRGDYERALWLAVAAANPHDSPDDAAAKEEIRRYWGDWRSCRAAAGGLGIPVFDSLVERPGDFRRAIAAIPAEQRGLYLAAYQSYLWNRMLATALRARLPADRRQDTVLAGEAVPLRLTLDAAERAEWAALVLPLPSARLHLDETDPVRVLIDGVLADQGISLRELRVKYPRDSFFSKGDRPALVVPSGLEWRRAADDLYPGREKLSLKFDLPRGAYATVLIKRAATRLSAADSLGDD